MNKLLAIAVVLSVAFLCGCTAGKKNCRNITEEAWFSETEIGDIPVKENYSEEYRDIKIIRDAAKVPLHYSIENTTTGVGRFFEVNESGYYSDYGRTDQTVTAYIKLTVRNIDDTAGNFTVKWSYAEGLMPLEKLETNFIGPNATASFGLAFNTTRGGKLNYSYRIMPGMKNAPVPYTIYEPVNSSGVRIVLKQNRTYREVLKNVTKLVCD